MIVIHLLILVTILAFSTIKITATKSIRIIPNPLTWVILLYIFSAILSIFIDESFLDYFDFNKYTAFHYLAYTFFIALTISPIILLKGYSFKTPINFEITNIIWLFYLISSCLIWFSLIYQIPYAISAVSLGAVDTRLSLNVEGQSVLPETLATTIAVTVSSFYMIFIMLYFIAIKKSMNRFFILSMFVGGILYVVSSLCFMARDGALFYAISFVFVYSLFRFQLSNKQRNRFKIAIILVLTITCLIVASITIQRFYTDGDTHRLIAGTVGYLGQQPYVFAETIVSQHKFYGLSLRLPLIQMLFGSVKEISRTEVYEWTFGTFLKDFYAISGWSSLWLLSLLFTCFFGLIFIRRKKYHPITFSIIIILYFHFMTTGVFYFRLGSRAGNLYIFTMVTFFFLSIFFIKPKKIRLA